MNPSLFLFFLGFLVSCHGATTPTIHVLVDTPNVYNSSRNNNVESRKSRTRAFLDHLASFFSSDVVVKVSLVVPCSSTVSVSFLGPAEFFGSIRRPEFETWIDEGASKFSGGIHYVPADLDNFWNTKETNFSHPDIDIALVLAAAVQLRSVAGSGANGEVRQQVEVGIPLHALRADNSNTRKINEGDEEALSNFFAKVLPVGEQAALFKNSGPEDVVVVISNDRFIKGASASSLTAQLAGQEAFPPQKGDFADWDRCKLDDLRKFFVNTVAAAQNGHVQKIVQLGYFKKNEVKFERILRQGARGERVKSWSELSWGGSASAGGYKTAAETGPENAENLIEALVETSSEESSFDEETGGRPLADSEGSTGSSVAGITRLQQMALLELQQTAENELQQTAPLLEQEKTTIPQMAMTKDGGLRLQACMRTGSSWAEDTAAIFRRIFPLFGGLWTFLEVAMHKEGNHVLGTLVEVMSKAGSEAGLLHQSDPWDLAPCYQGPWREKLEDLMTTLNDPGGDDGPPLMKLIKNDMGVRVVRRLLQGVDWDSPAKTQMIQFLTEKERLFDLLAHRNGAIIVDAIIAVTPIKEKTNKVGP